MRQKYVSITMVVLTFLIVLSGCAFVEHSQPSEVHVVEIKNESTTAIATFAGGCFWCVESAFDDAPGVISAISGYMGGHKVNPTYYEVSGGTTGHAEVVQITYDPRNVTYEELLDILWREINPTDPDGQFADRGSQYRPGIFYHTQEQKTIAEESRSALDASGIYDTPIQTEIVEASTFYIAEEYHQDYHKKNPVRYKFYRKGSGRDAYLESIWGEETQ